MKNMKTKKKSIERKKKITVDLDSLIPAFFGKKFNIKKRGRVFFERFLQGKTAIHAGEVMSVSQRTVMLWDATREQMFEFSLEAPLRICAASEEDLQIPLEIMKRASSVIKTELHEKVLEENPGKKFLKV